MGPVCLKSLTSQSSRFIQYFGCLMGRRLWSYTIHHLWFRICVPFGKLQSPIWSSAMVRLYTGWTLMEGIKKGLWPVLETLSYWTSTTQRGEFTGPIKRQGSSTKQRWMEHRDRCIHILLVHLKKNVSPFKKKQNVILRCPYKDWVGVTRVTVTYLLKRVSQLMPQHSASPSFPTANKQPFLLLN